MNSFLAALQLLTAIPAGAPRLSSHVAPWFPVVGALIGAGAVGLYRTAFAPRPLLALAILAFWALVTGGLHEDGLADTFDAFGGGRTREDILRILKDSRIGVFGALALMFSLLLRFQSLMLIPDSRMPLALLASQVLPRAGMVVAAYFSGPATDRLGGAFASSVRGWHAALALLFAWPLLPLLAAASWYFRRRVGGVTGDCLGAVNQVSEIAVLAAGACL